MALLAASVAIAGLLPGCRGAESRQAARDDWRAQEARERGAKSTAARDDRSGSAGDAALAERGAPSPRGAGRPVLGRDDASTLGLAGGPRGDRGAGQAAGPFDAVAEHLAQGRNELGRGNLDQASLHFNRVLKDVPNHAEAHHRLAVIADKRQDWATAETHYRTALRARPNDANLHSDFGYSLLLQERFADSERALNDALRCDAGHSRALNNLGLLYGRQGDFARAYATFRQAGGDQEAEQKMARLFPDAASGAGSGAGAVAAGGANRGSDRNRDPHTPAPGARAPARIDQAEYLARDGRTQGADPRGAGSPPGYSSGNPGRQGGPPSASGQSEPPTAHDANQILADIKSRMDAEKTRGEQARAARNATRPPPLKRSAPPVDPRAELAGGWTDTAASGDLPEPYRRENLDDEDDVRQASASRTASPPGDAASSGQPNPNAFDPYRGRQAPPDGATDRNSGYRPSPSGGPGHTIGITPGVVASHGVGSQGGASQGVSTPPAYKPAEMFMGHERRDRTARPATARAGTATTPRPDAARSAGTDEDEVWPPRNTATASGRPNDVNQAGYNQDTPAAARRGGPLAPTPQQIEAQRLATQIGMGTGPGGMFPVFESSRDADRGQPHNGTATPAERSNGDGRHSSSREAAHPQSLTHAAGSGFQPDLSRQPNAAELRERNPNAQAAGLYGPNELMRRGVSNADYNAPSGANPGAPYGTMQFSGRPWRDDEQPLDYDPTAPTIEHSALTRSSQDEADANGLRRPDPLADPEHQAILNQLRHERQMRLGQAPHGGFAERSGGGQYFSPVDPSMQPYETMRSEARSRYHSDAGDPSNPTSSRGPLGRPGSDGPPGGQFGGPGGPGYGPGGPGYGPGRPGYGPGPGGPGYRPGSGEGSYDRGPAAYRPSGGSDDGGSYGSGQSTAPSSAGGGRAPYVIGPKSSGSSSAAPSSGAARAPASRGVSPWGGSRGMDMGGTTGGTAR